MFCEQVGLVPLERAQGGRLRQAASVITEDSAVAARRPLVTSETMRDPSVTLGGDGAYYLVGTLDAYGHHKPAGRPEGRRDGTEWVGSGRSGGGRCNIKQKLIIKKI